MKGEAIFKELGAVKQKIINQSLLFGSLIGLGAFLVSVLPFDLTRWNTGTYIDLGLISGLLVLAFFRKKIHDSIKSLVMLVVLYLIIFSDLLKLGAYSDTMVLMVLIPFFSLMVYNLRITVFIFLAGMGTYFLIAFFLIRNETKFPIDFNTRIFETQTWFVLAIVIALVSFIIVVFVHQFANSLSRMIAELSLKNKALSESEQNYRQIFNSTTDAIFIHDLNGKILDFNSTALSMYGFTRDEFLSISNLTVENSSDIYSLKKAAQFAQEAMDLGEKIFEWPAKHKLGHTFWVEVALKKAHIMGDSRLVAVVRNIDEKKQNALELDKYRNTLEQIVKERTLELEEKNEDLMATNETIIAQREELELTLEQLKSTQKKLAESEKMASLGLLASGVAHEINNPLNFIQGGLMGLEVHFEENPHQQNDEVTMLLESIKEGVTRASTIVASLNHFSRQGENRKEKVSLHQTIDNCLVILNNRLKHKITVHKNYHPGELFFLGNEGRMHQAILNILSNAEQAIQDKGKIDIFTYKEQGKLVVSINDNGMGIQKDHLEKITEPFFTTKDPGKGTGLGLSITYTIIQEHNGTLEFITEPGKGTQTIISLPQNN